MDENLRIFEIWAPQEGLWSPWAKPILFTNLLKEEEPLSFMAASWLSFVDPKMMIILDLEGDKAVKEALGLALLGYRPVPLYNGSLNTERINARAKEKYRMAVDPTAISKALYSGSRDLALLEIPENAPPVFMLDSIRHSGKIFIGTIFDNRWIVFPQDFPSADFLKNQGISKVLVRSDNMNEDLLHILYRYREKGLEILTCNDSGVMKEYLMPIPQSFRKAVYRSKALLNFASNATGGFGRKAIIPDPSHIRYRVG